MTASEREPEIVLAIGVDASPTYFERLADLRNSLFLYGALLALVVMVISVLTATLITRPVRRLASAAERMEFSTSPEGSASLSRISLASTSMEKIPEALARRRPDWPAFDD